MLKPSILTLFLTDVTKRIIINYLIKISLLIAPNIKILHVYKNVSYMFILNVKISCF